MRNGGQTGSELRGGTALGLQDRLRAEFGLAPRVPAGGAEDRRENTPAKESVPSAAQTTAAAEAPPQLESEALQQPDPFADKDKARDWGVPFLSGSTANDHSKPPRLPASTYVGTLIINLLALALPIVILQIYDRILPNEATATLSLMVIGLVGVLVLDTAMKVSRAYVVGWTTAHHEYRLSANAMERILSAPSQQIEGEPTSVHIDRMSAFDAMREYYGGQSRMLLLDMPFAVVFLALMAFIGGFLVAVPVALFVILGSISIVRGRELRRILETRAQHDDRRYDFIIESLNGIETIKTMAMEPQIQRRFERLQKVSAETSHDTILLGNSTQTIGSLLSSLTMVSVVTVGALMVIHDQLTMGALAACTLLSGRTIQPLLKGLGLWTQLQRISVARDRLNELFSLASSRLTTIAPPPQIKGQITLSQVSFRHAPEGGPVLSNVNLHVRPGEIIGLRGGDGSGKSTLLKLICGELQPTSGEVRLDSHVACAADAAWTSTWIAQVPTDAPIFHGTIMDNLTMFGTGDAVEEARHAARLIGLERDIHKLPAGYDTVLSEGISEGLPSGLLQRLVIARALARKPRILLFDEGNSGLDAQSDAMLREGLATLKGKTTVILVTLRPSLLRIADRVYSLLDRQLYDVSGEYGEAPAEPQTASQETA